MTSPLTKLVNRLASLVRVWPTQKDNAEKILREILAELKKEANNKEKP